MGLISDYLEQCRGKCKAGDLDPCMIIGSNFRGKLSSYHEICRTLTAYSNSSDDEQKKLFYQQLTDQSSELETIKSGYLLGEKVVLSVWNLGKLQSSLMVDTVKLLLTELRKSYQAICDLRQKINHQLGETIIIQFEPPLESDIRKNMMKMIGSSIVTYLQDASVILNTSEFRKVVYDFAEIIRCFEQEQYNQPEKKIVRYYLEKDFKMKNGRFKCANCGSLLLEDIPYCLNCYERN